MPDQNEVHESASIEPAPWKDPSQLSALLVDGSLPQDLVLRISGLLPWKMLCILPCSCRGAQQLGGDEPLWRGLWQVQSSWPEPPSASVKQSFLLRMRQACVECGGHTPYVFTLLGDLRLCELCERAHGRYSLVSEGITRQFGLRSHDLAGMAYIKGPPGYGKLYLRSSVEKLRDELQLTLLKPKNSSCSNYRCKDKTSRRRRSPAEKRGREDSCCFDVSGLRLKS